MKFLEIRNIAAIALLVTCSQSIAVCNDPDVIAPDPLASSLTFQKRVTFLNPASNTNKLSILRVSNPSDQWTDVEIYAIDDSGFASKRDPISFTLSPQESRELTAPDLEFGNSSKGLSSRLCNGKGKWQLTVRSEREIYIMSLVRTKDGLLNSLSDAVPEDAGRHEIWFTNPASNTNQLSLLRIVNRDNLSGPVSITAIDDAGNFHETPVVFDIAEYESRLLTLPDLEFGNTTKGLTGKLGNGTGNWRLAVVSNKNVTLNLAVQSMIRTRDGFLANISDNAPSDERDRLIYFANPGSDTQQQSILRLINSANRFNTIKITAYDDRGVRAPGGEVQVRLWPRRSKQFTISELENINSETFGQLGRGQGKWHFRLTSLDNAAIEAVSLVSLSNGMLSNMSSVAPKVGDTHIVQFMNPASNQNKRSTLRIVNGESSRASINIVGYDDNGNERGPISFNLAANGAVNLTSRDLESGSSSKGLVGSLGNGTGKWRLEITSTSTLGVQSYVETEVGFLTNLSTGI